MGWDYLHHRPGAHVHCELRGRLGTGHHRADGHHSYLADPADGQLHPFDQKFYSENKFNPLGGCLPTLIQMPVFFALFSVLRYQIPEGAHFYGVFESLAITTNDAVSSLGIVGAWVYVLFVLAFGILTLVPMLLNTQPDSPQASQTKIMGAVMALMMIWFGWNVPVGVVLYYVTSSAWGVVQQVFITRKVMEKAKADEAERMANQPARIDVVRKERKPRPHKKG